MEINENKEVIDLCRSNEGLYYICEFISHNETGGFSPKDANGKSINSKSDVFERFASGDIHRSKKYLTGDVIEIKLYPKDAKTLDEWYGKDFSINYYAHVTIYGNRIFITNNLTREDGTLYTKELKDFILNIKSFFRDKKIESIGI